MVDIIKLLRDRLFLRDRIESDRTVAKAEESEQITQPHWVTGYDPITGKQIAQRLDGGTIRGDRISNAGVRHSTPVRVTSSETQQQNFLDWKPRVRVESPRRSLPPSPSVEVDAIAVLWRGLSGKSIKVLFSKRSADGQRREFFIGGDREIPTKIHEVGWADIFITNEIVNNFYLNNAGVEADQFVASLRKSLESDILEQVEFHRIEGSTTYEFLFDDPIQRNALFIGWGQWAVGLAPNVGVYIDDDDYYGAVEAVVKPIPESEIYSFSGTYTETEDPYDAYQNSYEIFATGESVLGLLNTQWNVRKGSFNYEETGLLLEQSNQVDFNTDLNNSFFTPLSSNYLKNPNPTVFVYQPGDLLQQAEKTDIEFIYSNQTKDFLFTVSHQTYDYFDAPPTELPFLDVDPIVVSVNPDNPNSPDIYSYRKTSVSPLYGTRNNYKPIQNNESIWLAFRSSQVPALTGLETASPDQPLVVNLNLTSSTPSNFIGTTFLKGEVIEIDKFPLGLNIEYLIVNPTPSDTQTFLDRYILYKGTITLVSPTLNALSNPILPLTIRLGLTEKTFVPFHWKSCLRTEANIHQAWLWQVSEKDLGQMIPNSAIMPAWGLANTLSIFPRETGFLEGVSYPNYAYTQQSMKSVNQIDDTFYLCEDPATLKSRIAQQSSVVWIDSMKLVEEANQYSVSYQGLRQIECLSLQIPESTPDADWQIHAVSYYEQSSVIKVGGFSTPFELLQGLVEFAIASIATKTYFLTAFKEQQVGNRFAKLILQYVNRRTQEIEQIELTYPETPPDGSPWDLDWRKSLTQQYLIEPTDDVNPCIQEYRSNPYTQIKGNQLYLIDPYQLIGDAVEIPVSLFLSSPASVGATELQLTAPIGVALTGGELLQFEVADNEFVAVGVRDAVEATDSVIPVESLKSAIREAIPAGIAPESSIKIFSNTFLKLIPSTDLTIEVQIFPTEATEDACTLGTPSIKRVRVPKLGESVTPSQIIGAFLLV